jgi:hypothetical protein
MTGSSTRRGLAVFLLGTLQAYACTDIPDPPAGDRVLGTIAYEGSIHLAMKRPAARVMAFVDFPPSASPLGFQIIEAKEQATFPGRVSYELKGIAPYVYKIAAQIVDLGAPELEATQLPLGGYPSFCSLLAQDQGWVKVTHETPATGIDFKLYDNAGAEDPCNNSAGICPQAGKATLNLVVKSSKVATASDRLLYALFSTFPSLTPARTRIVQGTELAFPQTLFDDAITPGAYPALYVCFDVNGDSGTGMCAGDDVFVLATPSPPIDFPAGMVVNVVVDMDTHTLAVGSTDDPAMHGCP